MITVITLQITLFLLIAVGFVLKRIHIVGPQGQKNLNDMVIYVILPCNILHAFTEGAADGAQFMQYLEILVISMCIQIFCVFYGKIMYRNESKDRYKCLQYGTICSNSGFLGNPISEGIYGAEGLVLTSFYLIPMRIMMWSSGLSVFTETSNKKAALKKVLTHPCIITCELGIILMLTGWKLPAGISGMVNSLSNCNTAMSMMVIGMILADIDPKEFWDWTVVKYTVQRLIVIPAVVYIVCTVLPLHLPKMVLGISVILAGMPAGATTSILAEKYDSDPAFATKMVIFSTLLSLPTICLWSIFLQA